MKSNRGITLTSLIIYAIGMTIAVGVIATLTSFFYKNVDVEDFNSENSQFTTFSSLFSKETNIENNYIIDCKSNYIIFSDGNQYTYIGSNKSIYKNNIKICKDVEQCNFSYTFEDGKYLIRVSFKTKNIDLTGNNILTYTL